MFIIKQLYQLQHFVQIHINCDLLCNFRTKYYEIDERQEGTETNNMWSGLLGELQKGKIDIGLQALIISHKMHDVIEPSLPVIQLR